MAPAAGWPERLAVFLFIALFLGVLASPGSVKAEEEDPTISLVKTIEIREFEGLRFSADEYTVEPGDSIARILLRRGVISNAEISETMVRLVMALNKELKDPNKIEIGQKLLLPAGPIEGLKQGKPYDPSMSLPEPPESPKIAEIPQAAPPAAQPAPVEKAPAVVEPTPLPKKERPLEERIETAEDGTRYRSVKVRKGDRLSTLLRQAGLPERVIFNAAINLTMRMNPELTDPNMIYAGQELRIPVEGPWAETAVAGAGSPGGKTGPSPAAPAVTRSRPEQTARIEKPRQSLIPPPPLPPSEHLGTKTALGLIFTRLGERFLSRGQHFLPLKTGGQITINTQTFPIIEFDTGQRIILDLDQRLPQKMIELIRMNWPNYTIFRPKRGEALPDMLGRLFDESSYYRINRKGDPWVFGGGVEVKIDADWIIWPSREDFAAGKAVVINLPASQSQGTSPEIAEYLSARGVRIIDFYPRGNLIGPEPRRDQDKISSIPIQTLQTPDVSTFVEHVLGMVGQNFETDLSIPLMESANSDQSYNFTVTAPIYFSRSGKNYVVVLDGLSDNVRQLFEKHNFTVVSRKPAESPQAFTSRLLSEMGIRTEPGLTITSSRNIQVTLPGVMFHSQGTETLLTPADIPEDLTYLLSRSNLQVVHFQVINPS